MALLKKLLWIFVRSGIIKMNRRSEERVVDRVSFCKKIFDGVVIKLFWKSNVLLLMATEVQIN